MSMSLQFIVPTSDLHGGIRLPLELAEWLTDSGWMTRVVGPGTRPDWHDAAVPWFSTNLDGSSIPRADVTIATFHTTVGPALRSKSDHTFHLCQGYEGSHPEYREIMDAIDNAYRAPIPKLLVSRHLEAVLNGRYPDCNCHFIGEAVDPRIFFPLGFRRDATPLRVGLVGTFEARVKGIREGLEGLRIARERGLEIEVHRASAEACLDEETALGVSDVFHHRLPTVKMPEFYAGIDILLFPSTEQEGFGLPVLEAFASGVPVVASDISCFREFAEDAATLVPPRDPASLAAAATELLESPRLWRRHRKAGFAVAHRFNPRLAAESAEEALQWVASGQWRQG